ncbi:MAG: hypothetical protein WDM92_00300 [Caulobacteraceae bacterium]
MVAVFEQGVRLGLAAAVGLAAMSAGGADAAGMPPAVYRLGTAAAAGAFAVTVLSVEPSRAASGCASDAAPCVAVVVRSSIQNVSPAPEALADIPSLRLLAADGAIVAPGRGRPAGRAAAGAGAEPGAHRGVQHRPRTVGGGRLAVACRR